MLTSAIQEKVLVSGMVIKKELQAGMQTILHMVKVVGKSEESGWAE